MIQRNPFAPARAPRGYRRAAAYLVRNPASRKVGKAKARMARLLARGGGADLQPRRRAI